MVNVSFFQELLNGIAERGRVLLPRALSGGGDTPNEIEALAQALVSVRGEASGVALAGQILARYAAMDEQQRRDFFAFLAEKLGPDMDALRRVAARFVDEATPETYRALTRAVEAPRQEFFRRLNLAPDGTRAIVAMRRDMQSALRGNGAIASVDADLMHLLTSWFNRGFLVLRRIDWSTPANILEKIIAYEAVHEIHGWDDLRRRLDPVDRRCFAFFHPSLLDEPLIFVEVALTREIPASIQELLTEEAAGGAEATKSSPTTAVFYSISNCQDGLRGISFGNFLIKQVVEELVREVPSLKTFVTLSPVPGFASWLNRIMGQEDHELLSPQDRAVLQLLHDPAWADDATGDGDSGEAEAPSLDGLRESVMALAAHYLVEARTPHNRTPDPVARFHLGNGARLERINWRADVSEKGLREAHGIMVNYLYDLRDIEKNHEAFANAGTVTTSKAVRSLLRPLEKVVRAAPAKVAATDAPAKLPRSELGGSGADNTDAAVRATPRKARDAAPDRAPK